MKRHFESKILDSDVVIVQPYDDQWSLQTTNILSTEVTQYSPRFIDENTVSTKLLFYRIYYCR